MDKKKLTSQLIKKWKYPKEQAPAAADELLALEGEIKIAFESWLKDGQFPEKPVYASQSPRSIAKTGNLAPPAVFLMLDWIRRDPEHALTILAREARHPGPAK